jgi:hypothetical protein
MPSERPHWWKLSLTNQFLVLTDDLLGSSLEEEVHLHLPTCGNVAEFGGAITVVGDDWGLSVGVSEVDTHEFALDLGLDQNKWMDTISLEATHSSIVWHFLGI